MKEIPAAPDVRTLREVALAYLARCATTEQGLRRVLERRLRRWATQAVRHGLEERTAQETVMSLRDGVEAVVKAMLALGAVNDPAFARSRAARLAREGRSRKAVAVHLCQRGVGRETVREALSDSLGAAGQHVARDAELAAALVLARKRRIGPFQRMTPRQEDGCEPDRLRVRLRSLGILARNGFSNDVAQAALDMDPEEAEDRIVAFRQGL